MDPQFIEIADGKLYDPVTNILRISRYHRDFSETSDGFQPVKKVEDTILKIYREKSRRCKNILTVIDYSDEFVYVEWVDGIPLIHPDLNKSWMHVNKQQFNFKQLEKAVTWLHGIGIAHLDLAPKNILVTNDGTAIICDVLSSALLTEERRNRDLKRLKMLEEELLIGWYDRINYGD